MTRDFTNPDTVLFGKTVKEWQKYDLETELLRRNIKKEGGQYLIPRFINGQDCYFKPEPIKDEQGYTLIKTVKEWQQHEFPEGETLMTPDLHYTLAERLMHAKQTEDIIACRKAMQELYKTTAIHTGVKITYTWENKENNKLRLQLQTPKPDGTLEEKTIILDVSEQSGFVRPGSDYGYFVLAPERPITEINTPIPPPQNAKPLLDNLFKPNINCTTFQYISPPNETTLKETRIYISLPTQNNTTKERAVVLYSDYASWFDFDCYEDFDDWPALSVATQRKKFSTGNESLQ